MIHKYQFYISFNEKPNTAASKAILDCKAILSKAGYRDFTLDTTLSSKSWYLTVVFKNVIKLFFSIHAGSIVAVQYPLLSGNLQFKYFIRALRFKKVKFFCVIHDLDELRNNEYTNIEQSEEAANLCNYDCIIVHNEKMQQWLSARKVTKPIILLQLFDYLSINENQYKLRVVPGFKKIAFAGNLSKSGFIYSLASLKNWEFNLYGPGFLAEKGSGMDNVCWNGSLSPEDILINIDGDFGLLWDGDHIDKLDNKFGHYLKYNNPHKFSLYLAAGLPVIAPKSSAISDFIIEKNIGILVDSLLEINEMVINATQYQQWKTNVFKISNEVKSGKYFKTAIMETESLLKAS